MNRLPLEVRVGMLAPSLVTINQSVASKTTKLVVVPPTTKGSRMGKDLARKTFAHHRKCSLRFNVDYLERVH